MGCLFSAQLTVASDDVNAHCGKHPPRWGVAGELLENWYVYNPERVTVENSLRGSSQGDGAN